MKNKKTKVKQLPIVTKKILNADYVQLWWSDINSEASWLTLDVALASKATICISTGWLIKKDKDLHIICADMNFNDDDKLGDVGCITTIPSQNVIKIKKIKL
jgi:hypothetical protein